MTRSDEKGCTTVRDTTEEEEPKAAKEGKKIMK